jgi:hypothetical protein
MPLHYVRPGQHLNHNRQNTSDWPDQRHAPPPPSPTPTPSRREMRPRLPEGALGDRSAAQDRTRMLTNSPFVRRRFTASSSRPSQIALKVPNTQPAHGCSAPGQPARTKHQVELQRLADPPRLLAPAGSVGVEQQHDPPAVSIPFPTAHRSPRLSVTGACQPLWPPCPTRSPIPLSWLRYRRVFPLTTCRRGRADPSHATLYDSFSFPSIPLCTLSHPRGAHLQNPMALSSRNVSSAFRISPAGIQPGSF